MDEQLKKFKDVFDSFDLPRATMNEFAMAEIRRIVVYKKARRMDVSLRHNRIIKERHIHVLQDELRAQMPYLNRVHIHIKYGLDDMNLEKAVNHYWENMLYSVKLLSPLCHKILETSEWSLVGDELRIKIRNSSLLLFVQKGIDKQLQKMLDEGLGGNIRVAFERAEDSESSVKSARLAPSQQEAPSPWEAPSPQEASSPQEAPSPWEAPSPQETPSPWDDSPSEHEPTDSDSAESPGKAPRAARGKRASTGRARRGAVKINQELAGDLHKLSEDLRAGDEILIQGRVFSFDCRELKSGRSIILFDITDGTSSITVKFFIKADQRDEFRELLKPGNSVSVLGAVQYDEYSKEINMMASQLAAMPGASKKTDDAPRKRVELHLHSQMSSMDGITSAKAYVKRAAEWGHKAIAITDHGVVQAFPEVMDACKGTGVKPIYGMEAYLVNDEQNIKKARYYHTIILARNYTGLRNLYELVSKSHLDYFSRRPRVPRSELIRHRDGLIIGTACEAGEFYIAVRENHPAEELARLAEFYDYFEIQPTGNNMYLVRDGKVHSAEGLMDINRRIVALGKQYKKPVVATCDAHFIDPEDEIYRRIIMAGEGFKDADLQAPLYFRTTGEMLGEFAYLGEDAESVVIDGPNMIADMVDEITPLPKGTFAPKIDGADDLILKLATDRAKELYGENLPRQVSERLDQELTSIIKNGFSVMYIIAQRLVGKSVEDGYLVGSRGSVGSSFAATMLGITEVNPLSAHYVCPQCKYSDFNTPAEYAGASGCDMPDRDCPECGARLGKDGHDIPFETFLGFDGDKEPDIDLNFSGEYQAQAHAYAEELFGAEHVFKAGTISTLADKTAYGFVKKYLDERGMDCRRAEINRITAGCTGIKRTTGQHPGGLMIVPDGHNIHEFCPVQRPANDTDVSVVTTHFDYHSIKGRLLKLDLLGHDVPTIIRMLHDITGIDPRSVDLGDKRTLSLFTSPAALKVTEEQIHCRTGSLGLPEFGTAFVRQMLIDTQPETFSELVRISGLSHGTDVWINNAANLIRDKTATLKEVIPTRDDIMVYLITMGVEKKAAFDIMESVRKGKGVKPAQEDLMLDAGVPEWYIESCKRIKYMFPKGHAVAYVMMTVRIAYFKIYHPYAFYAAIFSVKYDDFDYVTMCGGKAPAAEELKRLTALGKEASAKDKTKITLLELVIEMYARGLDFVKLDLYKADASRFIVTGGGLMPPLCSVQGLGLSAAQSIVRERAEGEFYTVEDFRERTKTNKTVIELLRKSRILDGIPETDQMSLF